MPYARRRKDPGPSRIDNRNREREREKDRKARVGFRQDRMWRVHSTQHSEGGEGALALKLCSRGEVTCDASAAAGELSKSASLPRP